MPTRLNSAGLISAAVRIVVGLSLFFALEGVAAERQLPAELTKQLRAHKIPLSAVSLFVQEVTAERPVLTLNEQVPRNPASTMKLVTTLAALELLGPAYSWKTKAYITGKLHDGRLDGDLILKGYGDPWLTPERFWMFLHWLRDRGIEDIRGDVIIDASHFQLPKAGRGDFDGKANRVYNALPHALSLNFQATRLVLRPDESGKGMHAFTYPPLDNVRIDNQIRLVSGPCRKGQMWPRLSVDDRKEDATLELGGDYSDQCPEFNHAYLLMDPADHVSGAFRALWTELGGQLRGKVRRGARPKGAKIFHSMKSPHLDEVIRGMNKHSNNLMSRLLLLTLAAERGHAPGTLEKGRKVVADWLRSHHLGGSGFVLDNGAGLSRSARISAADLGGLLLAAYRGAQMPAFMASLPVAGVDGTMRKRLRKGPLTGRVYLKTGSLRNVRAIAGYVLDRNGKRWAVVLMINHKGIAWQAKLMQEALLRWVYRGADGAAAQG